MYIRFMIKYSIVPVISNFQEAIQCHKERQRIAFHLGDKAAERRAYSNMGNGYIFLGNVSLSHFGCKVRNSLLI